jgi:hypothetical protein
MGGLVRFAGDDGTIRGGQSRQRRLSAASVESFAGGFIAAGTIVEGVALSLAEGWQGTDSAVHHLVVVALPDDHTVVGLELCRTADRRTYLHEVKGLHLNVPNDLFNSFHRRLYTPRGERALASPADADETIDLGGEWANVDGKLGVVGLYGGDHLAVHRSQQRRGGLYASLYVDEIGYPCRVGNWSADPNTVLLDVGWAVLSGVGAEGTERFAKGAHVLAPGLESGVRGVLVRGSLGKRYLVAANWGTEPAKAWPVDALLGGAGSARDLVSGESLPSGRAASVELASGQARVLILEA